MTKDYRADVKRTYIMSRVKQKDTRIEVLLRSRLHRIGFRFRKNCNTLPGSPDIVLSKYNAALFVHGCFWHGHDGCKKGKRPKSRQEYWLPKIRDNKNRDSEKVKELLAREWRVGIVWQCALEGSETIYNTINELEKWLHSEDIRCEIPKTSRH